MNCKEKSIPLREAMNIELADQKIITVDQVCSSYKITVQKQIFEINLISLIFFNPIGMNNPNYRGHKVYLSV